MVRLLHPKTAPTTSMICCGPPFSHADLGTSKRNVHIDDPRPQPPYHRSKHCQQTSWNLTIHSDSLNPVRVSRPATVHKGHGKNKLIIIVLNKIAQNPVHGTTIVPHDGQQSSMMNEKHVQKKPGVDHPIASVDGLGAYEVAHESFFHKNSQVAILNKELANVHFTCDLCRKTEFAPQNPLRPWFRWINWTCVLQFLIHSWHRIMPVTIDDRNPTNNWT